MISSLGQASSNLSARGSMGYGLDPRTNILCVCVCVCVCDPYMRSTKQLLIIFAIRLFPRPEMDFNANNQGWFYLYLYPSYLDHFWHSIGIINISRAMITKQIE
eukprot:sb/3478140/